MVPGNAVYNGLVLEANATTVVRTGRGVLHAITINTKGASSNVLAFYDGLTAGGTLLATIDTTVDPGTFLYDIAFNTGLTVVIGTGTAAKVTVAWAPL